MEFHISILIGAIIGLVVLSAFFSSYETSLPSASKPRLKTLYERDIVKNLMSKLNYKNKHQTPKLVKIVLNMGLGEDASDGKKIKTSLDDLSLITGQKPVVTKFKKSVANFKTRKGSSAGLKVTLRKNRMYEFLDRLVTIALPRVRDFHGVSDNSFDGSAE